jgi:hypothetical protein
VNESWGQVRGLLTLDLLIAGVLLEDGRAGKAEKLGVRKKLIDCLVIVAEL